MTTSSHCGMSLRLAPRNSGTSVCTASSWPGTIRFAYAIAGSMIGRPWMARAASTNAGWCRNGLDAVDAAPRCRTRTPPGSSSCARRAPTPVRPRPRGRRCAGSSTSASWRCARPRPMSVSMLLVLEVHPVATEAVAQRSTIASAEAASNSGSRTRRMRHRQRRRVAGALRASVRRSAPTGRGSPAVSDRAPRRRALADQQLAQLLSVAADDEAHVAVHDDLGRDLDLDVVTRHRFIPCSTRMLGSTHSNHVRSLRPVSRSFARAVAEWKRAWSVLVSIEGSTRSCVDVAPRATTRADPPIFVLHGFPTCSFDWRAVLPGAGP